MNSNLSWQRVLTLVSEMLLGFKIVAMITSPSPQVIQSQIWDHTIGDRSINPLISASSLPELLIFSITTLITSQHSKPRIVSSKLGDGHPGPPGHPGHPIIAARWHSDITSPGSFALYAPMVSACPQFVVRVRRGTGRCSWVVPWIIWKVEVVKFRCLCFNIRIKSHPSCPGKVMICDDRFRGWLHIFFQSSSEGVSKLTSTRSLRQRDLVQCSVGLLRASRAMANCLGTAQSDAPWLPLTFHRVRLRSIS